MESLNFIFFNLQQFTTIVIVHLFAVISPGPDFAVVTKQSFKHGRKHALSTSCGISIGILVHVFYCLVGIGYILSVNAFLFKIFKVIGALYLSYIGLTAFIPLKINNNNKSHDININSYKNSFLLGFITNVFNPKATLFFLSLFTLVIDATTPMVAQLFYGVWMSIMTGLWFSFVTFFFTTKVSKIFIRKYSTLIDKIMGIILIIISIRLILY